MQSTGAKYRELGISRRTAVAPRSHGLLLGSGAALVVFLFGSLLPVWIVWHFADWEAVGHCCTLWEVISQVAERPGLLIIGASSLISPLGQPQLLGAMLESKGIRM